MGQSGKLAVTQRLDQIATETPGIFPEQIVADATRVSLTQALQPFHRRAQTDDGIARLERQRRNTRLRTWIDTETGMWCLHSEFDPETGAIIDKRLHNAVEALFHSTTPETCPTDPTAKQHHLRALALFSLTAATGHSRPGSIDMTILVDAKTLLDGRPHDHSVIDLGLGFELPVETIRRMSCIADITPIIVGADGVHMELGRITRLANRDQRRALRAMYRGCAIPGCCITWDHVVIHHLKYFGKHNGLTNIDNLLPLCSKHHHLAHEGGGQLTLDAARNLTIERPDGTRMTTGPPQAIAA